MTVAEQNKLKEVGLPLRAGSPLREAEGGAQHREIVIISEGWGSSGYYSGEVIKRDIPRIFPVGTHMYLNHQTEREAIERPERDVAHLVGKIIETPRMAGIDMVAVAEVYPHWVEVIEAMAKDIGLSIVAYGLSEEGSAGGKKGPLITALTEGFSVDYVTRAGAGGKIGKLVESAVEKGKEIEEARNCLHYLESRIHRDFTYYADNLFGNGHITREERKVLSSGIGKALDAFSTEVESAAPQLLNRDPYADASGEVEVEETKDGSGSGDRPEPKKESSKMAEISDQELAELRESVKKVGEFDTRLTEAEGKQKAAETKAQESDARAERAEDALLMNKAAMVAKEALEDDKFKVLPGSAKARAIEAALTSGDLPTTGEGSDRKLDEAALKERVRGKADDEARYLAEAGVGAVQGFGSGGGGNGNGGGPSDAGTKAVEALQKRFEESGMSEAQAKAAAAGR